MKKIIVISVVALTLLLTSGCSNNATKMPETTEKNNEATAEITEKPLESTESVEVLDQAIIDTLNGFGDSETVDLVKMSIYLKENIENVSPENADLMLQIYEEAQMQGLPSYQDKFLETSIQNILLTYSVEELRQNQVKEEPVLALLVEAVAIGYKIEAIEGTIAPYVDYGYFAQFENDTSEPTRDFYALMKTESDAPSQKDAALLIPWSDVLKRGLNFEDYIETYPGSFYEDRARMHLEGYRYIAINGTANVPLFEYDTDKMNDEAKDAYMAFVDLGQQTEFATLIETYLSLLETHDFIKTAEVEAFMNTYN